MYAVIYGFTTTFCSDFLCVCVSSSKTQQDFLSVCKEISERVNLQPEEAAGMSASGKRKAWTGDERNESAASAVFVDLGHRKASRFPLAQVSLGNFYCSRVQSLIFYYFMSFIHRSYCRWVSTLSILFTVRFQERIKAPGTVLLLQKELIWDQVQRKPGSIPLHNFTTDSAFFTCQLENQKTIFFWAFKH